MQSRSSMYISDCVKRIDMIAHCDELIARPTNLGSSELVTINQLVDEIAKPAPLAVKTTSSTRAAAPKTLLRRAAQQTASAKI